jgi:hypothetical protein
MIFDLEEVDESDGAEIPPCRIDLVKVRRHGARNGPPTDQAGRCPPVQGHATLTCAA